MEVSVETVKNKMKLTITKDVADKNTQVFDIHSELEFSKEVKEIDMRILQDPYNSELCMEKGLALSKQMLFREAIEAYSKAVSMDPFNGLIYRHRGHRFLSINRFSEAASDFELSSRLDNNNWDTWYHLGLSYYLLGDYIRAEKAYETCLNMTEIDDETYVAIVNWSYLNYMKLGKIDKTNEILKFVDEKTDAGENFPYKQMVLVYKGLMSVDDALNIDLNQEFADHEYSTKGYGISMYLFYKGEVDKATEILEEILGKEKSWAAFGYLAACCELNRKK
jgi:tetratricopeptide (TPR) repeat protein